MSSRSGEAWAALSPLERAERLLQPEARMDGMTSSLRPDEADAVLAVIAAARELDSELYSIGFDALYGFTYAASRETWEALTRAVKGEPVAD